MARYYYINGKLAVINGKNRGVLNGMEWDNREAWETPVLTYSEPIVSTSKVSGVTKYEVYDNGTYIGYIDSDNVFHEEVSV